MILGFEVVFITCSVIAIIGGVVYLLHDRIGDKKNNHER